MGFWKNLTDAAPQKSHARADEVHQAGIKYVEYFSDARDAAGMVCSVCKATIGAAFAKDRSMYTIVVENWVSFQHEDTLKVCNKCVEHFRFK
jgi:hypothetical protein